MSIWNYLIFKHNNYKYNNGLKEDINHDIIRKISIEKQI